MGYILQPAHHEPGERYGVPWFCVEPLPVEEAGGQSSVFSEFTFSSGSCVAVCHSATVEVRGQPQGRLFLARYFT